MLRVSCFALLWALASSGCRGNEPPGLGERDCTKYPAPIVSAGGDRVVPLDREVWLDGSGSVTFTGSLQFGWELIAQPENAAVTLAYAGESKALFRAATEGPYEVKLTVFDGCRSAEDTVILTARFINQRPTALIDNQAEWSATVGAPAVLRAGGFDPEGTPLAYRWTVLEKPAASQLQLADPSVEVVSFLPDATGTFVFELVTSDGELESLPARAEVRVDNYVPYARAGTDGVGHVGVEATLDGSASSDLDKLPLQFSWTLTAPPGSAATLTAANTATPRFTPDVPGDYVARLTVTDPGGLSATDDVAFAAVPPHRALPADIVDAEYSAALDRLVLATLLPSALVLVSPGSEASTTIELYHAPRAVSVSPDGKRAIVAHNASLTYLSLDPPEVLAHYSVTFDITDVILTGTHAHAFAAGAPSAPLQSVRLSDGIVTAAPEAVNETTRGRLHPGGGRVYAAGGSLLHAFVVTDGPVSAMRSTTYQSSRSIGRNLWFTATGDRVIGQSGQLFWTSEDAASDFAYAGALEEPDGTMRPIRAASHSTALDEVATLAASSQWEDGNVSHEVRIFDGTRFTFEKAVPLPRTMAGGKLCYPRGRFLFHSADGTKRLVIVEGVESPYVYPETKVCAHALVIQP